MSCSYVFIAFRCFYQCDHKNAVLKSCPPAGNGSDLFWDPSKNTCNWPSVVDCQSKTCILCPNVLGAQAVYVKDLKDRT